MCRKAGWGLVRVDTQVIKRWEISNLLSRMTFGQFGHRPTGPAA